MEGLPGRKGFKSMVQLIPGSAKEGVPLEPAREGSPDASSPAWIWTPETNLRQDGQSEVRRAFLASMDLLKVQE